MSFYPSDFARIARAEIGYHEKTSAQNLDKKTAPNDGSGNYTKYARDLDAIAYFNGPKQGVQGGWCAVWYDWCIYKALGDDANAARSALYQPAAKYNAGAGCTPQAGYYRDANAFYTYPQVGDQMFTGRPGDEAHTGGVLFVADREFVTAEGNVQDQVMLVKHSINDPNVVGFGRPNYDDSDPNVVYVVSTGDTLDKIADMYDTTAQAIAEQNGITNPDLITTGQILIFRRGDKEWHTTDIFCKYGDRNTAVKMLQGLLLKRGLSLTYDGYFGAETRSAVMTWQRSQEITVDGIVGDETLGTL